MQRFLIFLIPIITLSGCCAMTQQQAVEAQRERRDEQIEDAQAIATIGQRECTDKRHASVLKTYAESALCSNPKIIAAYERVGFPYMDLVKEYTEKRLELLERLDKKKITEDRFDTQIDERFDYLKAETHVRDWEIR